MKNKLTADLILELADNQDETVRRRIAYNKNASVEALQKLSADGVPDIAEVARKRLAAAAAGEP